MLRDGVGRYAGHQPRREKEEEGEKGERSGAKAWSRIEVQMRKINSINGYHFKKSANAGDKIKPT